MSGLYACQNQPGGQKEATGQSLFEKNCTLCHGKDGKLMAAGAPDLSISKLDPETTLKFIEIGSPQKGMPAYGQRMDKANLEKIRDYVLELRTK